MGGWTTNQELSYLFKFWEAAVTGKTEDTHRQLTENTSLLFHVFKCCQADNLPPTKQNTTSRASSSSSSSSSCTCSVQSLTAEAAAVAAVKCKRITASEFTI